MINKQLLTTILLLSPSLVHSAEEPFYRDKAEDLNSRYTLSTIPDESKLKILSFLPLQDLGKMGEVDKTFSKLTKDKALLTLLFKEKLAALKDLQVLTPSKKHKITFFDKAEEYWEHLQDTSDSTHAGYQPWPFLHEFYQFYKVPNDILKELINLQINNRLKFQKIMAIGLSADNLFKVKADIYEQKSIIKACLGQDPDKIIKVAQYFSHLNITHIKIYKYISLLEAFLKLPPEKMERAESYLQLLLTKDKYIEDYDKLLHNSLTLTSNQLNEILATYEVYADKLRGYEANLETYLPLTPEQIKALAELEKEDLLLDLNDYEYPFILKACYTLSPEKIRSISLAHIALFRNVGYPAEEAGALDEQEGIDLMEACFSLTPEQMEIIQENPKLYRETREEYDFEEEHGSLIISALSCLTPEQIKCLAVNSKKLGLNQRTLINRSIFIHCLDKVTPEQISELSQDAPYILHNKLNDFDLQKAIIQAYFTLEPEVRHKHIEAIKAYKKDLFREGISAKEHGIIVFNCLKLTPEEIIERLNTIKSHEKDLFRKDMDEGERVDILAHCLFLKPEEITERLKTIKTYDDGIFKKGIPSYHFADIMLAYLELTPEQIINTSQNTKGLCDNPEWYSRAFLIVDCKNLDQGQTRVIATHAENIFYEDMDNDDRAFITAACLKLTPAQITERVEAIKTYTQDFIMKDISGIDKSLIIEACLNLVPEEIKERIEATKLHINDLFALNMDEYIRHFTIRQCLYLTPHELVEIIKTIKTYEERLSKGDNKYGIFSACFF
ncbi:hypothetical protein [Candidatus Paracaedibacter symbiosus]|uniref:hypothetical protein n=1 Tax=Candidatus Paracaedibacter symbiosus TaxID=244582 RepID=UPI000509CAF2|nr:hypothetical protein [Candidatus Paracaedibacter symbiosus]